MNLLIGSVSALVLGRRRLQPWPRQTLPRNARRRKNSPDRWFNDLSLRHPLDPKQPPDATRRRQQLARGRWGRRELSRRRPRVARARGALPPPRPRKRWSILQESGQVCFYPVSGLPDHYFRLPRAPSSSGAASRSSLSPLTPLAIGDHLRHSPYVERVTFEEMARWGGRNNEKDWDRAILAEREEHDIRTFGTAWRATSSSPPVTKAPGSWSRRWSSAWSSKTAPLSAWR